jgi:hypothetical protein
MYFRQDGSPQVAMLGLLAQQLTLANFKFDGTHVDAGEAAAVAKAFEYVFAEVYLKEYPDLVALSLMPVDSSVPPGAETFTYLMWDRVGKAVFISNYASDFPAADAFVMRTNSPVAGVGNSYQYTIQDLRAAASIQMGMGMPLDSIRAQAARDAHMQFIDQVAAFGDTARGIPGFANNANVPATSITGGWAALAVSDTNNAIIVTDLVKLAMQPEQATLGLHKADTLVLPLSVKPRLMQPTSTYDRRPLLTTWLENQQDIKNVFFWNKLDAANSAGALAANTARVIAYKRDARIAKLVIPLPFTQHPPQQVGLAFKVICESRIGGACIVYPLAMTYANAGT